MEPSPIPDPELTRATEILNRHRHRNHNHWFVDQRPSGVVVAGSGLSDGVDFSPLEAVAIARELERQRKGGETLEWQRYPDGSDWTDNYGVSIPVELPDNAPLVMYAAYLRKNYCFWGCYGLKFARDNVICFQRSEIKTETQEEMRQRLAESLSLLRRALT